MNTHDWTCAQCGEVWPDMPPPEGAECGQTFNCPSCGKPAILYRFPSLSKRLAAESCGRQAQEGEAVCFHHPDRQAETACEACGRFLCSLCGIDFNGHMLCPICLAQTQRDAASHVPRRLRYDKLALFSVSISPLLYCISIFNACLSLYLCFRHWRTPLSVLPYNRWRFVVAGVLAAALVALWLGLGGVMAYNLLSNRGNGLKLAPSTTHPPSGETHVE